MPLFKFLYSTLPHHKSNWHQIRLNHFLFIFFKQNKLKCAHHLTTKTNLYRMMTWLLLSALRTTALKDFPMLVTESITVFAWKLVTVTLTWYFHKNDTAQKKGNIYRWGVLENIYWICVHYLCTLIVNVFILQEQSLLSQVTKVDLLWILF